MCQCAAQFPRKDQKKSKFRFIFDLIFIDSKNNLYLCELKGDEADLQIDIDKFHDFKTEYSDKDVITFLNGKVKGLHEFNIHNIILCHGLPCKTEKSISYIAVSEEEVTFLI